MMKNDNSFSNIAVGEKVFPRAKACVLAHRARQLYSSPNTRS
eukprot:UN15093